MFWFHFCAYLNGNRKYSIDIPALYITSGRLPDHFYLNSLPDLTKIKFRGNGSRLELVFKNLGLDDKFNIVEVF